MFDERIVIEKRYQRTGCGERNGQKEADGDVNPKQIAGQRMRDVLALQDQLCEPIQAETTEQQTKSRDHGYDAEIGWCQQTREYHGRSDLHRKGHS